MDKTFSFEEASRPPGAFSFEEATADGVGGERPRLVVASRQPTALPSVEGLTLPPVVDRGGKAIPGQYAPSEPGMGLALPPLLAPAEPKEGYFVRAPSGGLMDSVVPLNLVRNPQSAVEGAYNTLAKGLGAVTSPVGAALGPLTVMAPWARPIIAGVFGGLGAKGAAEIAGTWRGTPADQLTTGKRVEMAGDIAQQLFMAAGPLLHTGAEQEWLPRLKAFVRGRTAAAAGPKLPEGERSEFGGEAELPPPSGQGEAVTAVPGGSQGAEISAEAAKTGDLTEPAVPVQTSGQAPLGLLSQTINDLSERREPIPASVVEQYRAATGRDLALAEGYAREGDRYVYQEPSRPETDAARMAREQREAMAQARQMKTEESAPGEASPDVSEATEPDGPIDMDKLWNTPIPTFERPPDILDRIGDYFPRGVKLAGAADFGDYLTRFQDVAKGRGLAQLRGLMSLDRGEPATEVIKALHEGGEYLRVQTPDELAEAMVRAGEARKGWATQERAAQNWEAKLDALKINTNGQLHAFGLVPEAWNTLIDLVKLGVRGGRAIAEAVDWAVDQFKAKFPGQAFDEAGAREHLVSNFGERATGQKVLASDAISPEVKNQVDEWIYQRRSMATDEDLASGLVKELGPERAADLVLNPTPGMPGMVRSKLLGEVSKAWIAAEREARGRGDLAAADALAKRQAQLWEQALPKITDLAQSLAGLRDIVELSPDAQVQRLRLQIDEVNRATLDGMAGELQVVRGALNDGLKEGVQALRQDTAVNDAARAAVNEHIAGSEPTRRAVVMDLAEEWSESPYIIDQARAQVRERAAAILSKGPPPAGVAASQRLRFIMDDLAKRAAGIAADYFLGRLQHADGLGGLLQERLGLDKAHAEKMAGALDREFQRQVDEARRRLPKRIASQRIARERATGASLESTQSQTDAAIREQLRELNLKLGEVLRRESGAVDATGQHVAERIVDKSGLEGEGADTLRTVLKNRWDNLVTEAQRRALEQLQRQSGTKVRPALKSAFEKLRALNSMGALTSERFFDVVKRQLKLKELTQGDAAELRRLVVRAQEQPEGFLRERAGTDIEKALERLSGNRRWWDVPMGMFYSDILSGFTTPAKIIFENTNLLVGNTVAELLGHPRQNLLHPLEFAKSMAGAYGRGLVKGGLQAESTLRTGVVTGVWARGRSNVMEGRPFGEGPLRFLNPVNMWKYFGRVIGTAHETTFKPAWEVKQTMIAREIASREGLRGQALQQRVANLMGNTKEAVEAARAQAVRELQQLGNFNKMDLARRTREIVEQERETRMPGSTAASRDFALRTAYLNEPYGFLGMIATGVRSLLEKGRRDFPLTGTALKTQVPFTTVVANILNEKLNWTPAGLVRAAASSRTGELYGRPVLRGERGELYAKAIVGTVAMGVLADFFGQQHIHGNGPSSPQRRRQLQATGWIPHSIEYGGRFYSYMNTPLALGLAVIGNYLDWQRYGKGEDADGVGRTAFALKATANAIVSQGMLDSVKRLFEALGSESTSEGADKMQKLAARTASSFVVPNAVQQVDRLFDPTIYDANQMGGLVRSQIPFVRRENRPVLNVLGEPVQGGPFHYWTNKQSEDPVWQFLHEKQVWIPEPSKSAIVGSKALGKEYYRAITPDEYYNLIAESGPVIRKAIADNLEQLRKLPPADAQMMVTVISDAAHKGAKAKLRP